MNRPGRQETKSFKLGIEWIGYFVVSGAVVADTVVVGGVGEDAELEDAFVSVPFRGDE